jgi:two-component system NtrC family sensor kinase
MRDAPQGDDTIPIVTEPTEPDDAAGPGPWPAHPDVLASAGLDRLQQELVQAQKMEAIGQLVSGVAHELNNPLAAIVAFSQLIRRDPRLPDDLRHDADLLVQEADRTRRIVQNLLDFARQRPPERHPTPLRALVASILDLQAYLISSSRVTVEVDVAADVPPVPLDRAQMQQVLLNLTLNAIQAIRSRGGGGRVTIRARRDTGVDGGEPTVRIDVADDGPGVRAEHVDQLFVPFFTTKEPGEGTGLGLPVSFGIVAAHGGRLRFEPTGGGGATFVIELPLALPAESVPTGAPVADSASLPETELDGGRRSGPSAASPDSPRPRVLVVDDEPAIRAFLAKALARAGYDAVLAEDGPDAVALVRERPFDAALCDHRMAGMTGTEVYDALVALRPELATRFVFMSGDVLNPSLREFADSHGVALLAKPFDVESVGRTVRGLLERESQARG